MLGLMMSPAWQTVWHVTDAHRVPEVLRQGLLPGIGVRSRRVREKKAAVFVFPDWTSLSDGLTNWLGEASSYRQAILELRVPKPWLVHHRVRLEARIERAVPPEMIRVLVPDIDEWDGTYPGQLPTTLDADEDEDVAWSM